MTYSVQLTQPAEKDLLGIYAYISQILKEPRTAARIYRSIRKEILPLSTMPERCPVICEPPYAEIGVRKLLVENYIVFYLVSQLDRTVTILRILYNRREWHSILEKALP